MDYRFFRVLRSMRLEVVILGLGIISGEHVKRVPLGDLVRGKRDCPIAVINAFNVPQIQFDGQSKKPHVPSKSRKIVEDPMVRIKPDVVV